jgi:hypothetical protein
LGLEIWGFAESSHHMPRKENLSHIWAAMFRIRANVFLIYPKSPMWITVNMITENHNFENFCSKNLVTPNITLFLKQIFEIAQSVSMKSG